MANNALGGSGIGNGDFRFLGEPYSIDKAAPDTNIMAQPSNPSNSASATFQFTSTEANSTFECKLDADAFTACTSPVNYVGLASGRHSFEVRATDAAHNTDPTPARFSWVIASNAETVLQGRVTDRSTGLPIAGVLVNGTFTDGNGNYALTAQLIDNNANGTLSFVGTGYFQKTISYTITTFPTVVNIELLPGGTVLQGSVTDSSTQAPVSRASLSLDFSDSTHVSVTTGADGRYTVDSSSFAEPQNIRQFSVGLTQVNVSAAGYFNYSATSRAGVGQLLVRSSGTYDFAMVRSAGVVLWGRVTNRDTGLPIAGVLVNGSSTIGTGDYALTAQELNSNVSGTLSFIGMGYFRKTTSYTITTLPTIVDATLLRGGTVLRGKVTDSSTQAPVAGVSLSLDFSDSANVRVTTGSDGRYTVDSSSFAEPQNIRQFSVGLTQVNASAVGYFNYSATSRAGVGQPLARSSGTYDFVMVRSPGAFLQGRVTDSSTGLPIAGVLVNGTLTDGDGGYALTAQQLNNNANGVLSFVGTGYFQKSVTYTIATLPTVLNVVLLQGGTVLRGQVRDTSTGAPIAGARLSLRFFDSTNAVATTDTNGRYTVDSSVFAEPADLRHFSEKLTQVDATAGGYFNYSIVSRNNGGGQALANVPGAYDFQMRSTGGTVQ